MHRVVNRINSVFVVTLQIFNNVQLDLILPLFGVDSTLEAVVVLDCGSVPEIQDEIRIVNINEPSEQEIDRQLDS